MRILLLIVMVLAVLVSTGMGLAIANENVFKAENQAAMEESLALLEAVESTEAADATKIDELKSALTGYTTSGWGGLVVGGLALILAIAAFAKKAQPTLILGILAIGAAVAFIALSPSLDMGENGPASPRMQAMVYGCAGMLAALSAMGADKIRRKRELGF